MHDKTANIALPPTVVIRATSAVPRELRRYLSLNDFEATARRRLPKFLYGYIAGGAESDAAVRDNRQAFEEYGFVPRVLNDVSGAASKPQNCSARRTRRRSGFRRWGQLRSAPTVAMWC